MWSERPGEEMGLLPVPGFEPWIVHTKDLSLLDCIMSVTHVSKRGLRSSRHEYAATRAVSTYAQLLSLVDSRTPILTQLFTCRLVNSLDSADGDYWNQTERTKET